MSDRSRLSHRIPWADRSTEEVRDLGSSHAASPVVLHPRNRSTVSMIGVRIGPYLVSSELCDPHEMMAASRAETGAAIPRLRINGKPQSSNAWPIATRSIALFSR